MNPEPDRASARASTAFSSARTLTALSIAGSDSGGGAGVQADLKAFAHCGLHGTTAITAITAQNTTGVTAIHSVPAEIVLAQVRAVAADMRIDAVKIGMLGTAEVTHAVAKALDELPRGTPVVVDPVMVAESGARLLDPTAHAALVEEILPRATVLTPNLLEARVLAAGVSPRSAAAGPARLPADGPALLLPDGPARPLADSPAQPPASGLEGASPVSEGNIDEEAEVLALAHAVLALGPLVVVLTGGHRRRATDLFLDSADSLPVEIPGQRHADGAAHGSGCTHSSVLAAQLALGRTPLEAARVARAMTGEAVANGRRDVGAGAGPVDVLGRSPRSDPATPKP